MIFPPIGTVAFTYIGLELLDSAGFWVDSGLSLPAQANHDARLASWLLGRGGASYQPPTQGPAGARRAQSQSRGQRGGGSAAERTRASGSAIREARACSRGCLRGEHYGATVRTRSGDLAGPPQTSQLTAIRRERAPLVTMRSAEPARAAAAEPRRPSAPPPFALRRDVQANVDERVCAHF